MPTLVHISDLHFGRDVPAVTAALLAQLRDLNPDCVIISGDLTQRATGAQYRAARQFLDQLHWPHVVIPGNHDLPGVDLWTRFVRPWRRWRRYLNLPLEPYCGAEGYRIAGVNTARSAGFYLDWSRGRINRAQTGLIASRFAGAPEGDLRIVVAHHPFWLPDVQRHRGLIYRRDAALQTFADIGVDLVLSGHVHLPYTRLLNGVIVSHAGTTLSNRLLPDQPNSFNLIRGDRGALRINTWCWDGHRFTDKVRHDYVRDAGAWQAYDDAREPSL
ncbi:MAG: metallophosphoesterase family protein [Spongiibacteraceae bacterium]|jgi:3',5'-cyclic AMP phosphodiesterase CpdA|nr:metallophosphoesterase family protein [Spongiibacteraceae bacterium]